MQSGVVENLATSMSQEIDSGKIDINKLVGSMQGLVSNVQQEMSKSEDPMVQQMMGMLGPLTDSLSQFHPPESKQNDVSATTLSNHESTQNTEDFEDDHGFEDVEDVEDVDDVDDVDDVEDIQQIDTQTLTVENETNDNMFSGIEIASFEISSFSKYKPGLATIEEDQENEVFNEE